MRWQEDWVAADVSLYADDSWPHHGLAITVDQRIVGFRSGATSFWILDRDGNLVAEWESDFGEGHGLTIVGPAGAEELWVADPAITLPRNDRGVHDVIWSKDHGRVAAIDLAGNLIAELPTPPLAAYDDDIYRPTAVEVADAEDGSVWVADGYGANLVHKFSREGDLLLTLNGTEGAGRFDCPHDILIDRRGPGSPELYVTDRGHHRIVVYDLEGNFLRSIEAGFRSPSGFALRGDELVVAELEARLTILDSEDRVVERIGDDENAVMREGWPNALDPDGRTLRPEMEPGKFNGPHGLAVDASGDIYVAEFVIDGRMVRLSRD